MWNIVGHEKVVETLRSEIARGRLPHALLVTGPRGVGKRTLAVEIARQLNCTQDDPPCGSCIHCRQIAAGGHPDITTIERMEGKDAILIEQVRAMRESASLRPFQSSRKVFIVSGAEALTGQAADALLKTLEEPQPYVNLILTATSTDSLPPTVLSRCRIVDLRPVPIDTICSALLHRGVEPERADGLARLSLGITGWAIEAARQPSVAAQREELAARLCGVYRMDIAARLDLAESLTADKRGRSDVRRTIELLVLLTRDLLLLALEQPPALVTGEVKDKLLSAASIFSLADIQRWLDGLTVLMERIDSNVDSRLALEGMLTSAP